MDFFDVIKTRKSIRTYTDEPISREVILKLMDVLNYLPSAGNLQPYEIILVDNSDTKKELYKASYYQESISKAPILFVILVDKEKSKKVYQERGEEMYSINDGTIVATYIQLAATALGLGSVWIGAFSDEKIINILNAPMNLTPLCIIPVGNFSKLIEKKSPPKRSLDSLVHHNTYNKISENE